MEFSDIKAVNGYIIKPLWDKDFKNGILLDIGYKQDDKMPARYWATQGEVVSANVKWEAQKGDTIYFTWNALSFANGCISPIKEENLFCLRHSYYAYKHDNTLYTTSEPEKYNTLSRKSEDYSYVLLESVEDKNVIEETESGIILKGYKVDGSVLDAKIVEKENTKKKLHGRIAVLPRKMPFDTLWNPFTKELDNIEIGLNVVCEETSDIPVEIDGKKYFRTRFSEIIYSYHD